MGIRWNRSGLVERDNNDVRAGGCLAYFFAGGTTTPLTVYEDAAETTPHEHPLEADANGRWPLVFVPFTASYDEKIVTSGGTQLSYHREIPNPDPVEIAEDEVSDEEIFQTGMWSFDPAGGTKTGWVRANGRTIGSASSGATERANDDTEDLYTRHWNNFADSILAVTGGRGASAAADFAANKPMALFDGRSASLFGVDDMGNSAAGIGYGGSFTTGNATTGGSVGGANTHALSSGELAAHTHTFSATTDSGGSHSHTGSTDADGAHVHTANVTDPGHSHSYTRGSDSNGASGGAQPTGLQSTNTGVSTTGITVSIVSGGSHTHAFTTASGGSHTHTLSGTSNSTGSGTAHNNMPKHVLGSFYIKL